MLKRKQNTFKIVLTGPESSGKTTMAQALAQHFNTNWSPEFARYYLAKLGRSYVRADLKIIGTGQYAWENWYSSRAKQIYFCDTDWTVLQIWEHYRYGLPEGHRWYWRMGYTNPHIADLYLLCAPDFPWQPDPLRENASERGDLFEWYEKLLNKTGANYIILEGSNAQRQGIAISEVGKLFTPLP